jgi:hypothetical protein
MKLKIPRLKVIKVYVKNVPDQRPNSPKAEPPRDNYFIWTSLFTWQG